MQLHALAGPDKGKRFPVLGVYLLGRDSSCGVRLSDVLISRVHGSVTRLEDGSLVFTDKSRNGTYYLRFGSKTAPATIHNTDQPLAVGDMLLMGETALRVEAEERTALDDPPSSPSVARAIDATRNNPVTAEAPGHTTRGSIVPPLSPAPGIPSSPRSSRSGSGAGPLMALPTSSAREILAHPFTRLAIERGRMHTEAGAAGSGGLAGGAGAPLPSVREVPELRRQISGFVQPPAWIASVVSHGRAGSLDASLSGFGAGGGSRSLAGSLV